MGMALAALLATLASSVKADETYRDRSIHQSTGKNGTKLKWLPYRPSERTVHEVQLAREEESRQVEFTSYQSSGSSDSQVNQIADNNQWQLPGLDDTPTPSEPSSDVATPLTKEKPSITDPGVPTPPRDLPENIRKAIEAEEHKSSRYKDYEIPVPQERAEGLFKQYSDCPSENDFKPIDELTDKVVISDGDYPKECKLPWRDYKPRSWESTLFTWKASGLCHNPLYFEDVQLERYGHSWGPYIQPIISQGHFFVTVPFLPYKMGMDPPRECVYSLGYYRPGNCAPYIIDPFPISVRGGFWETATVLGAVYLLP